LRTSCPVDAPGDLRQLLVRCSDLLRHRDHVSLEITHRYIDETPHVPERWDAKLRDIASGKEQAVVVPLRAAAV